MFGSEDFFGMSEAAFAPTNNEKKAPELNVSADNAVAFGSIDPNAHAEVKPVEDTFYDVTTPSSKAGFSYETDPVQQQFGTIEGIDYPCVYIICKAEELQAHRVSTLNVLVKSEADETRYPLYLEVGDAVSGLGSIDSHSLKTLFTSDLFAPWKIFIRLSGSEYYDDEMRLAFCS